MTDEYHRTMSDFIAVNQDKLTKNTQILKHQRQENDLIDVYFKAAQCSNIDSDTSTRE